MATALGIATTTYLIRNLLNNGLTVQDMAGIVGGNVRVTALPPDRIDLTDNHELTGLNLFMYQAVQNPGWRNEGLPNFDGRGQRVGNSPLALDLHYLLSAYGANELDGDILLGFGMQLLHETPVLTRDAIRQAIGELPANLRALSGSGLADQVEQIRITPASLNAEEVSRLWMAFQAKYRPTAAYKVTVVLIESQHSTRSALPVLTRTVAAEPVVTPTPAEVPPVLPVIVAQAYANTAGAGAALRSGNLTVTVAPPLTNRQRVLLLLNGIDLATSGHDYSFEAPPIAAGAPPVANLIVPMRAVLPGSYIVRLVVDGVPSLPTINVGDTFDSPAILIA